MGMYRKCQQSFKQFIEILQSDFMLAHFNLKLPIVVAVVAAQSGNGSRVIHKFKDGSVKEMYHSIQFTDRNHLQRYALILETYIAEYIKTANFGYAYILSRLINSSTVPDEEYIICSLKIETEVLQGLNTTIFH